jgi:primase-polymerase (primpol)-like protein
MAAPQFDNIPQEYKDRNQWVQWKTITRAGRPTKVPYRPNGIEADSSDPKTWSSYTEVVEAYHKGGFDGVGFVFDVLDPYAGIDLDHCINPDGTIKPKAKAILDKLDTYSEVSPSGTGIKCFPKAKNPVKIQKKDGKFQQGFNSKKPDLEIEIYYGNRFFTLTGNRLPEYPSTIETRHEELTSIFKEIFKDRGYFNGDSEPGPHREREANYDEPLSSDAGERLQALFTADPDFKADLTTPAPVGKRSDAEFHLCARLWEAGFAEAEIYQIMTSSPQTKWQDRGDNYRWETIRNAVAKAEASHRAESKAKEEPKGPTVLTAFKALLKNEDKIKGECLWNWRTNKPRIERTIKDGYLSRSGEEKAHKFLKQFKEILKDLDIDYFDLQPLLLKPKDNREEFSEEIKEKALEVLKNGNPVQFVADACGRIVLGAETAFKKLSSCVSVQNIRQSAGLHPKFSGDSGGGKTFISYTFAHHLPQEAVIKGSMSAKSGFYHKDGNRVLRLLDDYQDGNEDLDTTIKQTTSDFHSPYQHRTLIKQVAATLEIGSEQTWLVTSVDTSQDIQVINRQLPINVDDSVGLTKKVNDRTIERYGKAEEQRPTDETVLICRAMFQILRDDGYIDVAVPFWERIEWIDNSNRRNPSIFMDLVIAHTAMNRYQRERDSEGRYLATEDDFQAAKALFNDNDAEELVKRLTKRERDVIEKLVANPSGYTRDELAELLKVAPERISQIIGGQKGNSGLKQKVQIAETRKSETITVNKDTADEKRVTIHKTVFSLAQYDKWAGFDGVVKLRPATVEPDKPDKHQVSNPVSNSNDSSKNPVSNVSNKEKERKIEEERDLPPSSSVEDCSYLENEKKAYHAYAVEPDSESKAYQVADQSLPDKPREKVKFRTDYDTDFDGEMRHLLPGDVVEVPAERAAAWIKRGVAESA